MYGPGNQNGRAFPYSVSRIPHLNYLRDVDSTVAGASGLAYAPNGREPRLLVAWEPRWAEVTLHLEESGSGDVMAPGVEI